ncbi:MAG TPA: uL22 family ribosomal protein [archaeon]|nr:uL22 family ribosomal protein [archaeon]
MIKYAFTPTTEKYSRAYGSGLRISTKHSVTLCRILSGMNIVKGKILLENLLSKKEHLDGKYYTNTAEEILDLLKSAESNAEFKGLDAEKLIIFASAHRGFTFFRPRRMKMRRDKRKVTNVQIVLVQK